MRRKSKGILEDILAAPSLQEAVAVIEARLEDVDLELLGQLEDAFAAALESDDTNRAVYLADVGYEASRLAEQQAPFAAFVRYRALLAEQRGDVDVAVSSYGLAVNASRGFVGSDPMWLSFFNDVAGRQAALEYQRGRIAEARQVLADTQRVLVDAGAPDMEIAVVSFLCSIALQEGAIDEAADHAARAVDLAESLMAAGKAPGAEGTGMWFLTTAWELYRHEAYSAARSLVRVARRIDPDDLEAQRLEAFVLLRLEDFDGSAAAWRRIVEAEPDNAQHRANLAGALAPGGHGREAIEQASEAIRIDPDELQYLWLRARLHESLGDAEAAIDDYTATIGNAEARAVDYVEPDEPALNQADYERRMPPQDIADFARLGRIRAFRDIGDLEAALRDARYLVEHGDDVARRAGLEIEAEILADRGDRAGALDARSKILDADPGHARLLAERASSLLSDGLVEEALADLGRLAHSDMDPDRAVAMLSDVLDADPGNLEARRWRGFAHFSRYAPDEAIADLDVVLESGPDPDAYLWRGQSRIMTVPSDEGDEPRSPSMGDIIAAIDDFAHAAVAAGDAESPQGAEARRIYRWLVDRAMAMTDVIEYLRMVADEPIGIFSLVPGTRRAFEDHAAAVGLEFARNWAASAAKYESAGAEFGNAGLSVTAIRMNLRIADNLMRVPDLQRATECLEDVRRRLPPALFQPLTADLVERAAEMAAQQAAVGQDMVTPELEYLAVYGLDSPSMTLLDLLEAQAKHRLGDFDAAVEALGDVDSYFDDVEGFTRQGFKFRTLVAITQILRDAGRADDAARYLAAIEPYAESDTDRAEVQATMASLRLLSGDAAAAIDEYRAAHELLAGEDGTAPLIADLQLVSALIHNDRASEARQILDSIDLEARAESNRDRLGYYVARSQTMYQLDEWQETVAAVDRGLDVAAEVRRDLKDVAARISWQGTVQMLYEWGVLASLFGEDTVKAFNYVEKSQTRAFLDQLATGRLPLPDSASPLLAQEEAARRKLELIQTLARHIEARGPTYVDHDALRALAAVDPSATMTRTDAGGDRTMDPEAVTAALDTAQRNLDRVQDRIEVARIQSAEVIAGEPLEFADVQALLASDLSARPTLLVEFYTTSWMTFVFVFGENDEVPAVHGVQVSDAEIRDYALAHFGGSQDADVADLDIDAFHEFLGFLLSPLAEFTDPGELLWLVPHGFMHYLPLHAAEVDGQLLFDRNPVCFTSSASVMRHCRDNRDGGRRSGIVYADSTEDLPFAVEEAQAVGRVLDVAPVVGADVLKARVIDDVIATDHDIIHFACHGVFDPVDPMLSGIAMYSENPDDAVMLTAEEILDMELGVNLVTLSGCETAVAETHQGDELIGLSRALLHAGASAVVLSLWPVDDLASSLLMERFYQRHCADGLDKAAALQDAQRAVAGLDAAGAIELCDRKLAATDDPLRRGLWLLSRGDMHAAAGAPAAAIADYETASALLEQAGGVLSADLRRQVEAAVGEAEEIEEAPDYSVRPFGHPYYWAPFVLIGDWR